MKNKKAFTLIEIIVVIAIIAILSVIGFSVMSGNTDEMESTAEKNKMEILEQQVKDYKLKHGTYPTSIDFNK